MNWTTLVNYEVGFIQVTEISKGCALRKGRNQCNSQPLY